MNPLFQQGIGSAVFTVHLDENEVYRSTAIGLGDLSETVRVPLDGARWLRLGMHNAVNPTSEQVKALHCAWALHGVWAEPRLS